MAVDLIVDGAVARVVLNRPERMNALTRRCAPNCATT